MEPLPEPTPRVSRLLAVEWGDPETDTGAEYMAKFDRLLGQIDSPEELHTFVMLWRWRNGHEPMRRVLAHPLCDRGTALMVYWRLGPVFYLLPDRDTREKVRENLWPDALDDWDTLREAERRLQANAFASARMAYNPTNDRGRDRTLQRFRRKPPIPLLEWHGDVPVQVGTQQLPDDPEVDVHGLLPAFVFDPVRVARSPAGT